MSPWFYYRRWKMGSHRFQGPLLVLRHNLYFSQLLGVKNRDADSVIFFSNFSRTSTSSKVWWRRICTNYSKLNTFPTSTFAISSTRFETKVFFFSWDLGTSSTKMIGTVTPNHFCLSHIRYFAVSNTSTLLTSYTEIWSRRIFCWTPRAI